MSNVQSVIIDKRFYSFQQAVNYITQLIFRESENEHGYKLKKVDETKNFYRFRQFSPKKFDKYYVKDLKNNVKLVIGYE